MCLQPSSCFQVCTPGAGGVGRTSSHSRVTALQSWQHRVPTGGSSRRDTDLSLTGSCPSLLRCSTASTLSVRSSRAARRRKTARNQGQGTAARPASSSTPMPCRPPAPAHCPPARAPTHAHPTGSTNKGSVTWRGLGGPRWQQDRVFPPTPPRGAGLAAGTDTEQVSPKGRKGPLCSPQFVQIRLASRGRKWVFNLHQVPR